MQCHMSKVLGFLIVAVTICHVSIGEVQAELSLTPGLSLQVEYDDNLFLTDKDEVDDLSTVIVPNLSLVLKRKYLHTGLKYSLVFRKYLDETYLDEDKIKDIHRGDASGTLFPEGLGTYIIEDLIIDLGRYEAYLAGIFLVITALIQPEGIDGFDRRERRRVAWGFMVLWRRITGNPDRTKPDWVTRPYAKPKQKGNVAPSEDQVPAEGEAA
jgi:hypothetical protein